MPAPEPAGQQAEPATVFRRALYAELRQIAQGVFGDARVYALGALPTGGVPRRYVTWSRVDAVHERHLTAGAELVSDRYDVNAWARKLSDAEALADAFRLTLDNRHVDSGSTIGDATDRAEIKAIRLEGDDHTYTPPQDASASGWHRIRMDFVIVRAEPRSPDA